ncbi:MAG: hypothetical protein J6S28_11050 [Clostridia bacterium]|nr:hypothetical protein [Clostridia bacterium]
MKKLICAALLLCTIMLLSPLTAFAKTPPSEGNGLLITEICYDPSWKEGDERIEESADVFSYVEIYNPTDRTISLTDLSLCYRTEKERIDSGALICAGSTPSLAPGEIAVIVLYDQSSWTALGLDNKTEYAAAVWEAFTDLHGIADTLDKNHFFIATNKDFKLDKESANAAMELYCSGYVNTFTYDAVYYDRNNRAVVFGADGKCMGAALCKPGTVYDNQIPDNPALLPNMQTIGIKAVEYNICASGIPNDYEDIPFIADRQDEALALLAAESPDPIVLCEVNFAWQEYVQAFCEQNGYTAYGFSSAGKDFHGKQNRQKWDLTSLILWKTDRFETLEVNHFWCSSTPDKKGSYKWGGGLSGDMARCINYAVLRDKASGVELLLLGAHLDAKSEEIRTLSAQLIYERAHTIAGERPIIMLGDWNANQTHDSYRTLTSGNLADARFRTYVTDLHGTFNKWGAYSADFQTRLPIDHCLISKDKIWVESYKQVAGDPIENVPHPSDHNMTVFSLLVSTGEPLPETTEAETEQPTAPAQKQGGCGALIHLNILLLGCAAASLLIKKKHS